MIGELLRNPDRGLLTPRRLGLRPQEGGDQLTETLQALHAGLGDLAVRAGLRQAGRDQEAIEVPQALRANGSLGRSGGAGLELRLGGLSGIDRLHAGLL
ncbi:hypothetical protein D3C87_1752080 [compost metagenome]